MRITSPVAAFVALSLMTSSAFALSEPDGTNIPDDGSGLLQQLFTSAGDPISPTADGSTTPNAFSPLCGFTATFVLHSAGYVLGLAWYNETGAPPQPSDLHVIIPAGAPIGQVFTGTDIKNDPNYKGGLVGFAIVGQQTHYTNPNYNPTCDAPFLCNPQGGHWIEALIYPSKKTPNAFYIAFEDGNSNGFGFGNDGDFNDDVYFLTGITCQGGGGPCDTGKPGICGPGIDQCTGNGTLCLPLSPATAETCNGLDDDCNGMTDEGNICPADYVCDKGTCVMSCNGGEFNCPPNLVCSMDGYCVDPACANVPCPQGQVCVAGACKGPCDPPINCPLGQVCLVGGCVDLCANAMCPAGGVCEKGVCVANCDCQPCAGGKQCDSMSGKCVDPGCVAMNCAAGTVCVNGQCVDACAGAVCPPGQACVSGNCVATMTSSTGAGGAGGNSSGTSSFVGAGGDGATGTSTGSKSTSDGAGGGFGGSGGEAGPRPGSKGGCGCEVSGGEGGEGFAIAALALAIAGARRKRRR
jgi:MYXO-CTERM domain-containing protein